MLNMIVLWNTIYIEAALNQLRAEGYAVKDARLGATVAAVARAHQHAGAVFVLGARCGGQGRATALT